MQGLASVLRLKIVITVFAWCLPLLFFPRGLLQSIGFSVPEPLVFLRLLGMAYSALVVSYCFALKTTIGGAYPQAGVWVGIISNAGACMCLAMAAGEGAWSSWGPFAQVFMWGSLVGTAAITGGLIVFGPLARRSTVQRAGQTLSR